MATREYVKTSEMDAKAFAFSAVDGLTTYERVLNGDGPPAVSPSTLTDRALDTAPALYYDDTNGAPYFWDVTGQQWEPVASDSHLVISNAGPPLTLATLPSAISPGSDDSAPHVLVDTTNDDTYVWDSVDNTWISIYEQSILKLNAETLTYVGLATIA